jgi:1-acyl-sn-glycerol-3-phosphate acyltransferase
LGLLLQFWSQFKPPPLGYGKEFMRQQLLHWTRRVLLAFGRLATRPFLEFHVEGLEHLPRRPEPLILIANHFSWFDPPVLGLALPFAPAFLVATEAQSRWWVALIIRLFECIPIWRGQVDRQAIRTVLAALEQQKIVGIFPEGGINPELADQVARGETVVALQGNAARANAELVQARSGAALIAVLSSARILPVGLLGTEQILGNLRRWRRTRIRIVIGPVFGPLTIEEELTGQARRRRLDGLAHEMMRQIAELVPPKNRGYYQ